METAWPNTLPESLLFQEETVQQMQTFVYEVLDEHQAADFYSRHKKHLKGDFIYVFRVVTKDSTWTYPKAINLGSPSVS